MLIVWSSAVLIGFWSRNHVMLNGWSPWLLEHINCVRIPSVISSSKLNGDIRGGTVNFKFYFFLYFFFHSVSEVNDLRNQNRWFMNCVCSCGYNYLTHAIYGTKSIKLYGQAIINKSIFIQLINYKQLIKHGRTVWSVPSRPYTL